VSRTGRRIAVAGAAALVVAAPAPSAQAAPARPSAAPLVQQMVVFRDGRAEIDDVRARRTTVAVGRRRCGVAAGTPLAALARSRVAPLRLRDFGRCSRRPRDGTGLFVSGIGPDRNRRQDGWVYKVGRRQGTAGAADPSGPFGSGPIRNGRTVTWFYCHFDEREGGCQRTLATVANVADDRTVTVRVTGYDDNGRGQAVPGATVHAGETTATTDATGVARFTMAPGAYELFADKAGTIRSFPVDLVVG
jgi:hypothetical protein